MSLISGVVYTGQLNANQVTTGSMSVGGFTGMPSVVTVYNSGGAGVAEIGTITAGSGGPYYGVWAQNFWAGGSGPASAPISLVGSSGVITGVEVKLTANGALLDLNPSNSFGPIKITQTITGTSYEFDCAATGFQLISSAYPTMSFGQGQISIAPASGSGNQINIVNVGGIFSIGMTNTTTGATSGFGLSGLQIASLPSSSSGLPAGSFWYDPADSDRVKYVP